MLNCFSIDVESFPESNVEGFPIAAEYLDRAHQDHEIEENTESILSLLDEQNVKATFFFLGRIARDLPHVVRCVAQQKHEIGCHGFEHLRIYGLKQQVFEGHLRQAKGFLEDASGQRVYGFRAPDFSITRSSAWALDTLKEVGFIYDSSIFPFGWHDVYGIKEAQPHIHRLSNGLIEWPLATLRLWNRRLPFGGGGYFRLYPLRWTEFCFSRLNQEGHPCMFYIHPYEVGPIIPKMRHLSVFRRFRHYYNCGTLGERLKRLVQEFRFAPAVTVLREIGYLEEIANV
jgi:polysaccharide deacetylase family protein (PEP-CTERM system associated)